MEKILVQDPYNQKAMTLLNKTYKKLYLIGMARGDNDAIERMAEVERKWNQPILLLLLLVLGHHQIVRY
jgi:hypothetical protein